MRECRAKEVDFRNATLKNANFKGTDFKGALFGNTYLEGADFTDSNNTMIDIRANHLKGADFQPLRGTFFTRNEAD